MKKHITVLISAALISTSIIGCSVFNSDNTETASKTTGDTLSNSETIVSDNSVGNDETSETASEVKKPATPENLSQAARDKIDDEFYEMLKNADEDELFEYMVLISGDAKEAVNYRYPYDKSKYDWRKVLNMPDDYVEECPPIGKLTNGVRKINTYGYTEDIFIYYAEKARAIQNNHDFMKNASFSVYRASYASFQLLKFTKSQMLELLEDENVKGFTFYTFSHF